MPKIRRDLPGAHARSTSHAGSSRPSRAVPEFGALQAKADKSPEVAALHELQMLAADGFAGSQLSALPHRDRIERSFGAHRLDEIEAHSDSRAAAASRSIGAQAYTLGHRVAFASPAPTLHTAAHEAAHVVQQRAGLSPLVHDGDALERHADDVADAVVLGASAEPLLDRVASSATSARPTEAVQQKAVIGPNMTPATRARDANAPRNQVIDDDVSRRFKNLAELDKFARDEKLDVAGQLDDDTWIRVDKFTVLGEQHSSQKAPAIIKALGTTKYRYEGYSQHDTGRLDSDADLRARVEANDAVRRRDLGLDDATRDHAVEHADAKYARILPDLEYLAQRQAAGKGQDCVVAGTNFAQGYGLNQAILKSFLDALIYVHSYAHKKMGHLLKTVAVNHTQDIKTSIAVMSTALTAGKMPDLAAVPMANAKGLADLKTAFTLRARDRVNLDTAAKRQGFKQGLGDVGSQSLTDEANENDYLRDKSMFDTIKKHKGKDRLFIIGEAHRLKLHPKLVDAGIESKRDRVFLDEQKRENAVAEYGFAGLSRATFNKVTDLVTNHSMMTRLSTEHPPGMDIPYAQAIKEAKPGKSFTLPPLPDHFSWKPEEGCTVKDNVLTRTSGTVTLGLVFEHAGIREFNYAI